MSQRIGLSGVLGLKVQARERESGCHAVGPRNIFVSLLSWYRSTATGASVASNTKPSYLLQLLHLARAHRTEAVFAVCCLFVMAVSVHDAMLVVLNADIIGEFEHNPVGRWLIKLQGGEIWLFVLAKFVGTAIAIAVLVTLYELRARLALVAGGGVASFQMILLWYLTFARI